MVVLTDIVYPGIDEMNKSFCPEGGPIPKTPEALLFGKGGALDSMGLVYFILLLEGIILDKTGVSLVLANERAMSQERSPFKSTASMAAFIEQLLKESENV